MKKDFNILTVEDDTDLSAAIARGLRKNGFLVFEAGTSKECMQVLENNPIDIILMDVVIPGINGMELAKEIHSIPKFEKIYILFMSGFDEYKKKFVETDYPLAVGYISKPIRINDLVEHLNLIYKVRITERRNIYNENKFVSIFENTHDAILIADDNARYIDVNIAACNLLEYAKNELLQLSIWDISPGKNKDDGIKLWKEFIKLGSLEGEYDIITKENKTKTTHFKAKANILPGMHMSILTDITEKKKNEKELLANHNRYIKSQEIGHVGNWEYNLKTDEFWGSAESKKIYGFTKQNDLFSTDEVENQIQERKRVHQALIDLIKHDKKYDLEFDIITKDKGIRKTIHSIAELERDSEGKPYLVTGVIRDVTEQKHNENEINKYKIHLEKLVKERLEEIETKNKKLYDSQKAMAFLIEDVNEARNQLDESNKKLKVTIEELEAFSYSVSHDLRAPLTRIDGFSKALMEILEGKLEEKSNHYLNRIRASSQKMAVLIDELLSLSRITRKNMTFSRVDMSKLVEEVFKEQVASFNNGTTIEFKKKDGVIVNCDGELIRILVSNLISNAIKFTSKTDKPVIEFGTKKNKNSEIIFISDNGVGFDMKYYDKIFKPFQRLHPELEFEGTGIGLATVQRVINRHNWEIWAESEVNIGTTLYINYNK